MNITDVLLGLKKDVGGEIATKIQIKTESSKIEKKSDQIIDDVMRWISDEVEFINNGLSYSNVAYPSNRAKLTDEEKKMLIDKLLSVAKEIPSKIKKTLADIIGDEKKEESKDKEDKKEEKKPEVKEIEIEIEKPVIPSFAKFGY